MKHVELVFSCEHGGNRVPAAYRELFRGHTGLLDSHRGYDPGAAAVARNLAHRFEAPVRIHRVTRLLVDPNRSPDHPRVFSEITRPLPAPDRERIRRTYHEPHRSAVRNAVLAARARGAFVVHIAVHSFTPALDPAARDFDVALLYDPARPAERAMAGTWKGALEAGRADLRVRRNVPYRGASDGLPTSLRRELGPDAYAGFELELSQALGKAELRRLTIPLYQSLEHTVRTLGRRDPLAASRPG